MFNRRDNGAEQHLRPTKREEMVMSGSYRDRGGRGGGGDRRGGNDRVWTPAGEQQGDWRPGGGGGAGYADRPRMETLVIVEETIQVERKEIHAAVLENERGRFLKVTERCGDRRSSVIVPDTGLNEFGEMIARLLA